jgi:hypothetical protein
VPRPRSDTLSYHGAHATRAQGNTPLHHAAAAGCQLAVELLLDAVRSRGGPDKSSQEEEGRGYRRKRGEGCARPSAGGRSTVGCGIEPRPRAPAEAASLQLLYNISLPTACRGSWGVAGGVAPPGASQAGRDARAATAGRERGCAVLPLQADATDCRCDARAHGERPGTRGARGGAGRERRGRDDGAAVCRRARGGGEYEPACIPPPPVLSGHAESLTPY